VGGGGKISSKRPKKPDQFDRFQKNLVVSEIQKSGNAGDLTLIKSFPINFFAINKFGFFSVQATLFKDYLACRYSLCFLCSNNKSSTVVDDHFNFDCSSICFFGFSRIEKKFVTIR